MNTRKFKRSKGVSLIEIMIAVAILSVTVIGASGYRYYANLDAREADDHIAAARIGLLLCESWRGLKGATDFDPTAYFGQELAITVDDGFSGFAHMGSTSLTFNTLGSYQVMLNGMDYHIVLSWADINPSLRALNVVVGRLKSNQRQNQASYSYQDDPYAEPYTGDDDSEAYKLFKLTTYTEI